MFVFPILLPFQEYKYHLVNFDLLIETENIKYKLQDKNGESKWFETNSLGLLMIKFIYSEKATKILRTLHLTFDWY